MKNLIISAFILSWFLFTRNKKTPRCPSRSDATYCSRRTSSECYN